MPFASKKQERFFQAVAHGFKPTEEKGPSQAVAKKFIADAKKSSRRKRAKKIVSGAGG